MHQRLIAGGRALVFPNQLGGYIHVGTLRQRVWYPALKKAGLKRRDLYNTRDTFATHALASAEDPGWVQKMLGHTTLMMLMTRYYRYVPNLTRRDATRPAIGAAAVSEVCPYFARRAFRLSVRAA